MKRSSGCRAAALLLCLLFLSPGLSFAQEAPTPEDALQELEKRGLVVNRSIDVRDMIAQIRQENLEAVKLFLAAGIDPNRKDEQGQAPLLVAVETGNPDLVEAILEAGADLSIKDQAGRTPLMLAASRDHQAVVERILALTEHQ